MAQTILLVEDDYGIADSLAEVLSDEGYHVITVGNGLEALEYLRAQPAPSVILLDLMMPLMDGYEFRRRQTQDAALAAIPTIVFTAGTVDQRLAEMKATGWLRKPIHLDSLFAVLDRIRGARTDRDGHRHTVHFYQDTEVLVDSASDFLGAGLLEGEAVVALVTAGHLRLIRQRLEARGVDVAAAQERGQFTALDAATTLAEFKSRGELDERRARRGLGELLDRVATSWHGPRLRAFGEMVNLLWQEGNLAGAVWLEALWNELIEARGFSLYCAYRLDRQMPEPYMGQISRCHSHVVPAEQAGA